MSSDSFVSDFVAKLAELRFENAFNPYTDVCPIHDFPNAPAIRRRNLELVLAAAISGGIGSMWVARDLGYRGGRRTGLALTDEKHLDCHAEMMGGAELIRATKGPLVVERTASIVWRALQAINRLILLWNVFPLHPHAPDAPASNRCHTAKERKACEFLTQALIEKLAPQRIVAIGRDAQAAMAGFGVEVVKIRHPSYGGQSEFLAGISDAYQVSFEPRNSAFQPMLL